MALLCAAQDVQRRGRAQSSVQVHIGDKSGQLLSFTSGAGPVKAITSCIVSLSSVNLMVPIPPPAVTVGGVALLPSSSAEHLSLAALCGAVERFVCSLVLQEKAAKRCCDICVTKDAQDCRLNDCNISRRAFAPRPTLTCVSRQAEAFNAPMWHCILRLCIGGRSKKTGTAQNI